MILALCYHCEEEYPRLRYNQRYCCTEHQVKAKSVRYIARRAGIALLAAGAAVDMRQRDAAGLRGWLLSRPRA